MLDTRPRSPLRRRVLRLVYSLLAMFGLGICCQLLSRVGNLHSEMANNALAVAVILSFCGFGAAFVVAFTSLLTIAISRSLSAASGEQQPALARTITDSGGSRLAPAGTWFDATSRHWEIGATTRSRSVFVLAPTTVLWIAIAFYVLSLPKGPLANSFVAMCCFVPVLAVGGIGLIIATLMAACGKVVIRSTADSAYVFTGVGPVGLMRRFNWQMVSEVLQVSRFVPVLLCPRIVIVLRGSHVVRFGSILSAPRREFIYHSLVQRVATSE